MRSYRIPPDAHTRPELVGFLAAGARCGDTVVEKDGHMVIVHHPDATASRRLRDALDAHEAREREGAARKPSKARRRVPAATGRALRVLEGGA